MAAQQLAVNVVDFAKARLPELEALDEELDKNQRDAPRHLRRRARSHTAPFLAKKNPNNPNPTRRARRKPAELLKAHDPHAADVTLRFLETHVWHAKRFAMVDDGGWRQHANMSAILVLPPNADSGGGIRRPLPIFWPSTGSSVRAKLD